jgi:hypothetical protein
MKKPTRAKRIRTIVDLASVRGGAIEGRNIAFTNQYDTDLCDPPPPPPKD